MTVKITKFRVYRAITKYLKCTNIINDSYFLNTCRLVHDKTLCSRVLHIIHVENSYNACAKVMATVQSAVFCMMYYLSSFGHYMLHYMLLSCNGKSPVFAYRSTGVTCSIMQNWFLAFFGYSISFLMSVSISSDADATLSIIISVTMIYLLSRKICAHVF